MPDRSQQPKTMTSPIRAATATASRITLHTLTPKTAHHIPRLVHINRDAMLPDPLYKWMEMYTPQSEEENAREVLERVVGGEMPEAKCVFAVLREADEDVVAGFVQWEVGRVDVGKLRGDKEAKEAKGDAVRGPNADAAGRPPPPVDAQRARRLAQGIEIYADSRQHMIRTIRWRKFSFIRRLMVDPRYQRRGIAARLMRVATDEADEKAMPLWLYSRPAGVVLYEKCGFLTAGITVLATEELPDVPQSRGMVRWPVRELEDW